jgi:hypothetical protein
MADRIEATPVRYPYSFAVAGDSGAWPDPTADAIFSELAEQASLVEPAPVFLANLGDFAGPGTVDRHHDYLGLVEPFAGPSICVVGNHDLDAGEAAADAWDAVHGPRNFTFAYGHTRFVAIDGAPRTVDGSGPTDGPSEETLAWLDDTLSAADEPHRIVLTHAPPSLGGRLEPHAEIGFEVNEPEFLALVKRHRVGLVCCAHGLAFDQHVHDGTRYVMSGCGGTAICSHLGGVCTPPGGNPASRGAVFGFVHFTITEDGGLTGRVVQAFEPDPSRAVLTFDGALS